MKLRHAVTNIKNRHLFSFSVQTYIDTYKYIEVKKSVFFKIQRSNCTVTFHNNKTEDVAQYSSEFAFFHKHCTILYTVKAETRSHNCWFLPVESVHAAVTIKNEKRVQFLLVDFRLKSLIQATFRETVITTEQSVLRALTLMPLTSPQSQLQCRVLPFSASLSALSRKEDIW